MFPYQWITQAAGRIAPHIQETPLTFDERLNIYLKWENQQITGSFKVRGALNKVLALEAWEVEKGLVAASAGNHGQGLALAGKIFGAKVTVFASEHAVPDKVKKMRALGAEVRLIPGGYEQAEAAGLSFASDSGQTWVSPYNDPHIIAGQGTIGLELTAQTQIPKGLQVILPVSGGGLLSGVGSALKEFQPLIIGAQAQASPFMHALLTRNTQENTQDLPSLSDGLTGAIETNAVTIPLVKSLASKIVLLDEEAIALAMAYAWHEHGQKIEGSAAVGLAAVLTGAIVPPAIVVISGGNVQPEVHAKICSRYEGKI